MRLTLDIPSRDCQLIDLCPLIHAQLTVACFFTYCMITILPWWEDNLPECFFSVDNYVNGSQRGGP
jgi:hypothetical protein